MEPVRGVLSGHGVRSSERLSFRPPLGCRVRYAYGRAQYKRNHVTDAAQS